MMPQASNIEFSQKHIDNVFSALISTNEELKSYFDKYVHEEYDEDFSERLRYLDISEIARFIISRTQSEQTDFFHDFFIAVEVILMKCDNYVNDLIIFGLFECIQNNCGWERIDYYQSFDKWLRPISKQKWDSLIDRWEGTDWREKITSS